MAAGGNARSAIVAAALIPALLLVGLVMAFVLVFGYASLDKTADAPLAKADVAAQAPAATRVKTVRAPSRLLVSHVERLVKEAAPDPRLKELVVSGRPVTRAGLASIVRNAGDYASQVEEELQFPGMPSGCEIVSLGIALRAQGFAVRATEIADEHLVIDGKTRGYLSSPYGYNGGGLPPGIARAANSFLRAQRSEMRAHDLTGTDFATLGCLTQAGYPVLVWVTEDFTAPYLETGFSDRSFWYWPEHCMVLYGVDGGNAKLSDPLKGYRVEEAELVAGIYEACGSFALAVF